MNNLPGDSAKTGSVIADCNTSDEKSAVHEQAAGAGQMFSPAQESLGRCGKMSRQLAGLTSDTGCVCWRAGEARRGASGKKRKNKAWGIAVTSMSDD